jgi:hypothetical protein
MKKFHPPDLYYLLASLVPFLGLSQEALELAIQRRLLL